MKKTGMIIGVLAMAVAANAATVTFTGTNGAAWSVGSNWSDNTVPDASDDAVISGGSTVNFDYGSGWPENNAKSVQVDGTVEAANAVRSWATVWNIGSTGTLDMENKWLVQGGGGSQFNFDSGATLNMGNGAIQFGKDDADQTLGFNLEATGFQTLSAYQLEFDGYVGQTIKADMASYTGGNGTIKLLDLDIANGMTDTIFQNLNLDVANTGDYASSALRYDEVNDDIVLDVIPEPATIGLLGISSLAILAIRRRLYE